MTSQPRPFDLVPRRLPPRLFRLIAGGPAARRQITIGSKPASVLVVRTDEIGDLALTVPLLKAMRSAWPTAAITVVAKPVPAQLMAGSPLVDHVVAWTPVRRGQNTVLGQVHAWRFAGRNLTSGHFDLAVLPRRDIESGGARYIAAASRAQSVVGFSPDPRTHTTGQIGERRLLTTAVAGGDPSDHELEHGRRLMDVLGITRTAGPDPSPGFALLTDEDRSAGRELLHPLHDQAGSLIAVALGAGEPKRRWTPARYARVLNAVHSGRPVKVIVLGGPQDTPAAGELIQALDPGIPVVDAVGRASLRTSLAVLSRCDVYLGGDTGTMHLASSVATPCVAVSCHPRTGSTTSTNAPNRFGPWAPDSICVQPARPNTGCDTECRAATAHCIEGVKEAEVAAALNNVFSSGTASRRAGMLQ